MKTFKRKLQSAFLSIIILLAFTTCSLSEIPVSSPVNYIQQAFDVIHYSAFLDFSKAPLTDMSGMNTAKIYWLMNPTGNNFYFHLKDLTVDSVSYDNKTAVWHTKYDSTSESEYYYVLPPENSIGDTALIKIYYHGRMTNADSFGGVWSSQGLLFSVGVGFRNSYVSSTRHWLACYDHPSDKATFDFTFITPANMVVASNGLKQTEEMVTDNDIEKSQTVWSSKYPIATNLMTFAVSDFSVIDDKYNGLPIVIYTRKSDSIASAFTYKKVPEMLRTMEKRYGKYPFDKAGYVNTTISGGAMEHQTMVTMNETEIRQLYAAKDSVNETAAHELSHQWFGNSVTPYDYRDAWFNEGFATFAANVWYEDVYSFDRYLYRLSAQIDNYVNYYSKNEGVFPLYDYPRIPPSSNYPITIYYKGGAVLAMLRFELGDSVFFESVRNFLKEYENGNMTTNLFKENISNSSGKNLDWFFDQWVFGRGFPVLDVKVKRTKSTYAGYYKAEINITQSQDQNWGIYQKVPLEINFYGLDGTKASTIIKLNNKNETFNIDSLPDFQNPVMNQGHTLRSLMKINTLTTYVNEIDKTGDLISIHPNPADDLLVVGNKSGIVFDQYSITDVRGEKIIKDTILYETGKSNIEIDVRDLFDGSYYLTIYSGILTKTFYFIISR